MSRTKSKNKKTSTRSPPKTRKTRQTKMTDYYKRNKKVPTFQEIFEHRNMFPETKNGLSRHTWRDFVEYLDTLKSKENPYKIQLFCADANIDDVEDLDDPCDYDNMLDIRKPLTKKYLDNLFSNHIQWLNKKPYDYEGMYYDSHTRFKKLKQLPSAFLNYVNASLFAKNYVVDKKLPIELGDYILRRFVTKDESYKKMMDANKTRKSRS